MRQSQERNAIEASGEFLSRVRDTVRQHPELLELQSIVVAADTAQTAYLASLYGFYTNPGPHTTTQN